MKILQEPVRFQELALFGVHTMARLAVVGLVVILVSAWALTEPFYELGIWLGRDGKSKKQQRKQQIKN